MERTAWYERLSSAQRVDLVDEYIARRLERMNGGSSTSSKRVYRCIRRPQSPEGSTGTVELPGSAVVTPGGDIRLPRSVREKLGVIPGDRVTFREQADGSIVIEATSSGMLSLGRLVELEARGSGMGNEAGGRGASRSGRRRGRSS